MESQYNLRSPAVKRLMKEAKELREPTEQFFAQPLEDNLFEWHFTVRGPPESDFDSGCYHGRIVLPPEYPMKPPSILLLTPNGRFEVGKKICLSISGHHPETWQPSWSIRTVLLAIIGFMPTQGGGAIGSLDYTPAERKVLAKKSQMWTCESCGYCNKDSLKEPSDKKSTESKQAIQEAKELAAQISFKEEAAKTVSPQVEPTHAPWPGAAREVPGEIPGIMGMMPNPYPPYAIAQPPGFVNMTQPSNMNSETVGSTQGRDLGLSTDGNSTESPLPKRTSVKQEANTDMNSTNSDSPELRQRITSSTTENTNGSQTEVNRRHEEPNSGRFTLILIWIVFCLLVILAFRRLYSNML